MMIGLVPSMEEEETSFFSLPHEDTFEPGREFSAESEHAVP